MLSIEQLEARAMLSIADPLQAAAALPNPRPEVAAAQGTETSMFDAGRAMTAQAQATTAITSVRDGLWSNPATWSGGRVPGSTDDVVIVNNVTIDHAQAHQLDINAGTATLAGDLQAYASVVVRSKLVGTQGGIYFHVASDRSFTGTTTPGPDPSMPDFQPQDIGLWVLHGASIDLEGPAVSSWLNVVGSGPLQDIGNGVAAQVTFGATSATLQSAPSGWQTGDTLLLVNEHGQSVLADLVSVSGASLQYHQRKAQPTDPDLIGHTLTASGSNLTVYSKIANLTRRIQIVAADVHEGDTNHRAHTSYLNGATATLVNVEFRDLGPRGIQGRYPVYFNYGGASTSNLSGSSIWQDVTDPGNRFVAVHQVQGVTIVNNVAFRSRGNGFFLEDGTAYGNTLSNNLSVQVSGGEEIPVIDSNVTSLSHHFWLRAGNSISGNVAAGGDGAGMIVLASSGSTQTVVANSEALGAGLFGMWSATPNVTFANPIAVFNSRAGFASEPAWDVDSHGAVLNNPLLLFNGTSDSAYGSQVYMNNSALVAINGGVLAGVKAFHTHYHSAFTASSTQINVDTLLTPTYWEQAATLDHVTIHAALLFERAYPAPRYTSPGVVRFVNTTVQIGNGPSEVETSDYLGDTFQNYPALQGDPIPNAIELHQPAPASGFIRVTTLPDDQRWMTNIRRWTVTPIGQTSVANSFIYQRQTAWTTLAGLGGYPDGFPPGQYAVSLYTDDGQLLKTGFADVRSGQVSDLTDTLVNNAPVVTTSAGIAGAVAGGGAVMVDSAVSVSDVNATVLTGASVTIQGPNYVAGQDSLGFTNQSGITGSFSSGSGVLTLTGSATLADYQTALRSVTYINTAPRPFNGQRTVSFVVSDGSATSNSAMRQVDLYVAGDMNADGAVNNFDIAPFELALLNPSAYVAQHPTLADYQLRGDVNRDGALDNFDIPRFETLLTGGQAPSAVAATVPRGGNLSLIGVSDAVSRPQPDTHQPDTSAVAPPSRPGPSTSDVAASRPHPSVVALPPSAAAFGSAVVHHQPVKPPSDRVVDEALLNLVAKLASLLR